MRSIVSALSGKKIIILILGLVALVAFNNCTGASIFMKTLTKSARAEDPPKIYYYNSLLVLKPEILNRLNNNHERGRSLDMGYLLGEFAYHEIHFNESGAHSTVGEFVVGAFNSARGYQDRYEAYYNGVDLNAGSGKPYDLSLDFSMIKNHGNSMGGLPDEDRYVDHIIDNWRDKNGKAVSREQLKKIVAPEDLMGRNFRLLGIANRMDLAGDMDDRISANSTKVPRYLGEIHLVYGLVDKDYEQEYGKACPATYVLAYRLPPLKGDSITSYKLDENEWDPRFDNLEHFQALENDSVFKDQIKKWANLWVDLTTVSRNTQQAAFQQKMERILRLAIRPHNFLSLKSNTQINANEYELREWYMFKSGQRAGALIARFPRREPFKCLDGSPALQRLLDYYWDSENGDLDMTSRNSSISRSGLNDEFRGGYGVLRNNHRPLFGGFDYGIDFSAQLSQIADEDRRERVFKRARRLIKDNYVTSDSEESDEEDGGGYFLNLPDDDPLVPASPDRTGKHYFSTRYWASNEDVNPCGKHWPKMPFAMLSGPSRREPPFTDGSKNPAKRDSNLLMMLAPFARVHKFDANQNFWSMGGVGDQLQEMKRHSFAIRTCSGCHSEEGATVGFHISPRLNDEQSKISGFLDGSSDNQGKTNQFKSPYNRTYRYHELESRRKFLLDAYLGRASMNDGLFRPKDQTGVRH